MSQEKCVFCSPKEPEDEYVKKVQDMKVSTLYIQKNQAYEGYCLLIFNQRHVDNIGQLSQQEWQDFSDDLYRAQNAILKVTGCDLMNLASLGNVISHLHWHIIPRYKNESRWGKPIWMTSPKEMPQRYMDAPSLDALIFKIQQSLLS